IEPDGNLDGKPTTVALPAKLVDSTRVEAEWKGGLYAGMPADEGVFSGTARVIAKGGFDLLAHATPLASVSLTLANDLEPSLYSVEEGVIFVNHRIFVNGAGYLLGG